ncbi:MAG: ribosomal protein L3 glutamine methyltransferase [Oceanospirillaceae bacterium]|jgi:ribosomal protein L3 glutamine methyltransferase
MIDRTQLMNSFHSIRDYIRYCYSQMMQQDVFLGHGHVSAYEEASQLVLAAVYLPWNAQEQVLDARLLDAEKERVIEFMQRRITQREPLPYIINQAWFMQMPFYVDTRVLIPRSPIAQLIENQFSPFMGMEPVDRILDLCTGSGCIGIACGYAFEEAVVDITDISESALEVAKINVNKHEMQDQVNIIESDLFENISEKYQLIVSNPPYVDKSDLSSMPAEYQHEPALALGSGDDGLDLCKKILEQACDYLTDDGLLVVEVGNSEVHLMEQYPQVPFIWVELEAGGNGVFAISAADLKQYRELF